MLWNGSDRAMGQRYQLSAASANSLDLSVQPLTVREAHDFDAAFAKMERDPPDAGFMVVDRPHRIESRAGHPVRGNAPHSFYVRG